MNFGALIIIFLTVVIHLIGIGLFIVWLVMGKPTSKQDVKSWWKNFKVLPW